MEAISHDGMVKVEWTDLGEGLCGDYNPDDPTDEALLRYDAWVKITGTSMDEIRGLEFYEGDEWGYKPDGSYCTMTPVDTHGPVLEKLAQIIADHLADNLDNGGWKREAESMSYANPDWARQAELTSEVK
jgi:hypothetical protein